MTLAIVAVNVVALVVRMVIYTCLLRSGFGFSHFVLLLGISLQNFQIFLEEDRSRPKNRHHRIVGLEQRPCLLFRRTWLTTFLSNCHYSLQAKIFRSFFADFVGSLGEGDTQRIHRSSSVE